MKGMKLYIAPRRTDKTWSCITWMLQAPHERVIMCVHENERKRVINEICTRTDSTPEIWRNNVTTMPRFRRAVGHPPKEVVIDNAELLLQHMLGINNLAGVTFSLENVEE